MATCKAGCYCGLSRSEKMIKNWNREATTVFANKSSFKITPTIATINMSWNVSKLPCCFSWSMVSMLCMWNYTVPVNDCGLGWATWRTCVYVSCFVVVIERKWLLIWSVQSWAVTFCSYILGQISLRSCPLPIIPLCLSREEGMIHFFVGSHVKKARIWTFLWLDRKQYRWFALFHWPKCRHLLVVVDFSLHFCLRNEQWIHAQVHYKTSAGSVFLNLKNA